MAILFCKWELFYDHRWYKSETKIHYEQHEKNKSESCVETNNQNEKDYDDCLENALNVLSNPGHFVAKNLRMMINGITPYEALLHSSEAAKGIWFAAADIIEYYERQKLH